MALAQQKTADSQYRKIGEVGQYPALWAICSAIWLRLPKFKLPGGKEISTKSFKGGDLWAVDLDGKRYVEQNPNTHSPFATRARDGAKIIWVIQLSDNKYLGYIEDGDIFMK